MNPNVDRPTDELLAQDATKTIIEADQTTVYGPPKPRPICDPALMELYRKNAPRLDHVRRQMSMADAAAKFILYGLLVAVAFVIMLLVMRH